MTILQPRAGLVTQPIEYWLLIGPCSLNTDLWLVVRTPGSPAAGTRPTGPICLSDTSSSSQTGALTAMTFSSLSGIHNVTYNTHDMVTDLPLAVTYMILICDWCSGSWAPARVTWWRCGGGTARSSPSETRTSTGRRPSASTSSSTCSTTRSPWPSVLG